MTEVAPPSGGDELRRAVQIMDVLRSPGGCPWDAAQTHETLRRYLLEESYEVLEAIDTGDTVLLREELGDLLLQVLFHARLAQELSPADAFGIDEVAHDLVEKLVRRHPHVFGPGSTSTITPPAADTEALNSAWEAQKIREKGRTSALDGIPVAQPSLALAAKVVARVGRAGLRVEVADEPSSPERDVGLRLLALVREAVGLGVDPEGALRTVTGELRRAVVEAEDVQRRAGGR